MKIKEQIRKLAGGCSKQCFEVVDKTDEVSANIYGKESLTWFEFNFRRVLTFNGSHSNTLSEGFLEDKEDCYYWHSCKSSPCHN